MQGVVNLRVLQIAGYFALVAIAAVGLSLSVALPTEGGSRDFWLNLGTEASGILLAVVLIDSLIRLREQRETNRYRRLALLQTRRALHEHLRVLVQMYKATAPRRPPSTYHHVEDLLAEEFIRTVQFLDFAAEAPIVPRRDWFSYLNETFGHLDKQLDRIIARYGPQLGVEAVEVLQDMIDSRLSWFIRLAPSIKTVDQQEGFNRAYGVLMGGDDLLRDHVDRFLKVVKFHNRQSNVSECVTLVGQSWRDDVAPRFGTSRLGRDAPRRVPPRQSVP